MDNLQLKNRQVIEVTIPYTEKLQQIHVDDNTYCFITGCHKLHIHNTSGAKTVVDIPEELYGEIVQLTYLSVWKSVFIATESNLIAFDVVKSKFSSSKPNSTGKVVHASWNPTQTFLVVIDDLGALTGYFLKSSSDNSDSGKQFVPLVNGSLQENVPNSVYVGWGAQNTQFKGSKKKEEKIIEIPQEYSHPNISWRGNGEMFVVNYWKDNRRFLKVFDENLQPLFGSEPVNNLLAQTSFKGKGNFIACAAFHSEANLIVIFEKNCLMKSSFLLPENKGEIKGVQYHNELHILAVHSQSPLESCLNIYLYANDTWYLKQQLCYPLDGSGKLLKFHWVNDLSANACSLNVLTTCTLELLEFTVEPYGVCNDLVAVINGRKVLFTEFSQEIVPPPMASKTLDFDRPVNRVTFYPSENVYEFSLSNNLSVCYKYENQEFVKYDNGSLLGGTLTNNNNMSFFEKIIDRASVLIAINKHQYLMIDEAVVMSNVSSVHVHGDYLLFTHISRDSYKLYSTRLTEYIILNWNPETFFSREVEQGAKIICVTNTDQVILAMPRGNLETITCRLIAIDSIERLLAQNQWCAAISQIRSQKLNWNLLIDLNKQRFVSHIRDFIEGANTVSLLNTIVTEFGTENCLKTMYKAWYSQESPINQHLLDKYASKIPKIEILSTILETLVQLNPIRNLLSLVTLQIKHYSIKAALKAVLHAFELNQLEVSKKAVGQIILHKHANDVISAAYTLYNIDFLSFIYSCCSVDPRIFSPEIEELQTLNPIELRFTMNLRGKHFENATKYLVRLENKEEDFISNFINKYSTQGVAYSNVRPADPHFKLVTKNYADYLALKTRHNEAGLILERAGLHEEALVRYKIARNWQKVINLLNALNVQDDSKQQSLRSLAQDLINHKQVEDGALIYEQYCGDYKAAVEALIEHNLFQKAIYLARQYNSGELIDILIRPKLKKYKEDLYDRITELGNKFGDYTKRLLLLREKKCEKLLRRRMIEDGVAFENDGTEIGGDVNSEYGSIISKSSMGSLSSAGSKSSSLSSRNRRKMERKKTDLREGGTFEDIALIRQLYLWAVDIFAMGQEVKEICYSLIDEDGFKYGKMLQNALEDVQSKIQADIPRIWSDTFLNADISSQQPSIVAVIENRHELDEQFKTPPPFEKLKDNWKLLIFS